MEKLTKPRNNSEILKPKKTNKQNIINEKNKKNKITKNGEQKIRTFCTKTTRTRAGIQCP